MGATCLNLNGQSRGIQQELQQESQQESVGNGTNIFPTLLPSSQTPLIPELTEAIEAEVTEYTKPPTPSTAAPFLWPRDTLDVNGVFDQFVQGEFSDKVPSEKPPSSLDTEVKLVDVIDLDNLTFGGDQQQQGDSNSGGLSGRDVSPNPNSKFDLTIGVKGVGLDSSALDGVNALQPTLDLSGLTVNFIPDQFNVKRDSKRKRRMLQKRTALRKP